MDLTGIKPDTPPSPPPDMPPRPNGRSRLSRSVSLRRARLAGPVTALTRPNVASITQPANKMGNNSASMTRPVDSSPSSLRHDPIPALVPGGRLQRAAEEQVGRQGDPSRLNSIRALGADARCHEPPRRVTGLVDAALLEREQVVH